MARAGSAARWLVLALSVGLVAAGVAQSAGSRIPRLQADLNLPTAPSGPVARKLDIRLLDLAHGSQAARRDLPTLALASGNRVRVELRFAGSPRKIAERVTAVGGVVEGRNGSFVQALVPVSSLTQLARAPRVRTIGPPRPFLPAFVPGQGIASSGAAAWHAAGATGAGVKVAIIDFGFGGYRQRQAEGELPTRLNVLGNYCGPGEFNNPANDHGTAVAEIVHETAPGAELFLICADTLNGLENAKDYAISRGVRVINMSGSFVGYSRGDGTGDPGTPEEIIADARTRGVLWVNAAGNWGDGHWSGLFDDPDDNKLLNFAPPDNGNAIRLATGEQTCALLKWDEWPVTDEDYDFFLVRQSDVIDVERSMNVQNGTQPPVEFLCYTNRGPAGWYWLVVRRNGGGTPVRLDLFTTQTLTYQVPDGSIDEQAASPSAFAVGAVCWQNGALRPYSARGPTIDERAKPNIVAPDGVSGGTYGLSAGCSGGFQGTSASAPYVAGAAALVKQAHPAFSMGELQEFLETRAIDSGPPGLDNHFGVGRLSLGPPPVVVPPPPQPPTDASCVVPRLRGMLLVRAKQLIRVSGCSVGKVRRAYSTRVPRGRVAGQSPKAGRRLEQGHPVNLVQSRGRRPARSQNRR